MPLTDAENVLIGAICGTADTTLLQSTNYWKNAQQQRLPFTMDPRVLYRGYTANVINNGFCVASQFFFNGVVRTALAHGRRDAAQVHAWWRLRPLRGLRVHSAAIG